MPDREHRSTIADIERSRRLDPVDLVPLTENHREKRLNAAADKRRIGKGGLLNARTVNPVRKGATIRPAVRTLVITPMVTSPARTVIDMTRVWSHRAVELDRLIDDAVAARLVTVTELAECADRVLPPRSPGRRGVVAQLDKRGGGFVAADSALEALGMKSFAAWGLPKPVLQYSIPGREQLPGRVDFAFPDHRVVIELDGRRWHLSEYGFQSDRARDRATLLAGWRPFRFTWADFTDHRGLIARQQLAAVLPTGELHSRVKTSDGLTFSHTSGIGRGEWRSIGRPTRMHP